MEYILGTHCGHQDHDEEECGGLAYLHDEGKKLLTFQCKADAYNFLKDNRWSPKHVLVIPKQEGVFNE